MKRNSKWIWDVYLKDRFICVELNGQMNCMIDTYNKESLQDNKQRVKDEILTWAAQNIRRTEVNGFKHLL